MAMEAAVTTMVTKAVTSTTFGHISTCRGLEAEAVTGVTQEAEAGAATVEETTHPTVGPMKSHDSVNNSTKHYVDKDINAPRGTHLEEEIKNSSL